MKNLRQNKILEIIEDKEVETQYQLLEELKKAGFNTTQATVSRDIKDMRLVKELGSNGSYKYAVSSTENFANYESKLRTIFRESVTNVDYAQNLVIMHTLPGAAHVACSALDGMEIAHLVGTLAGDDTAFIAMRDTQAAQTFCTEIKQMLV